MIYEPSEDSRLLEKEVVKRVKGKSFLDMGAGSGIQSDAAKQAGAILILAVDKDPEVISFLKKKGLNASLSDLFSNVIGTFDVIAFNPPYLPEDAREDKESGRITSGGKRGDEIIVSFLRDSKKYLAKDGCILLVLSSLTPVERIQVLLKRLKLTKKILSKEKHFMEELQVWLLERL